MWDLRDSALAGKLARQGRSFPLADAASRDRPRRASGLSEERSDWAVLRTPIAGTGQECLGTTD